MDFNEFKKLASRTLPNLSSHELDLSHMIMGMISELNELEDAIDNNDIVNISEEGSDIMWYLSCYDTLRKLNLFNVSELIVGKEKNNYWGLRNILISTRIFFKLKPKKELRILYKNISIFTDYVKKHVAYGKEINQLDEMIMFGNIVNSIIIIFDFYGINIYKSLGNVIDKLIKRFPLKFTKEDALNRNLDLERIELEK